MVNRREIENDLDNLYRMIQTIPNDNPTGEAIVFITRAMRNTLDYIDTRFKNIER